MSAQGSAPPPPGPRRVTLAAMILLQAALFAALSRTLLLPAGVAIAAVLGALPRERAAISRARFLLIVGGIGAACLALWRVLPHYRPEADMDPAVGALGHALGQWALAGQALCLFLDWGRERSRDGESGLPTMPAGLPAAGVVVLLSAGDIRASDAERGAFLAAAVLFALLCGAYFSVGNPAGGFGLFRRGPVGRADLGRPGRWPRRAALLAVVVAVAGLTWGASLTLRRYERTMDRVVRQFLQPEPLTVATGYGGEARLGDVRERQQFASRTVALRCYAPTQPGYLRGRAYYTLAAKPEGTRWVGGEEESRQRSAGGVAAPLARRGRPLSESAERFLFDFTRPPPAGGEPPLGEGASFLADGFVTDGTAPSAAPGRGGVEVWPAQDFRGAAFVPPNTVRFLGPEAILDADEYGLTLTTSAAQPHYAATTEPGPNQEVREAPPVWKRVAVALDPTDDRLTAVPPLLAEDPDVQAVAERAFAGSRSTAGDIAAVENYFRRNYEYRLGAAIGSTGNPVREFLVRRPAAHCEYFATAAVVLLRMRGVPARYATGFVVAESNPVGGYWLARNEDAHAWCEAWDPNRGWVVVEATPPAGVPGSGGGANLFGQLWDAAAAALVRWRQLWTERGWNWLLGALGGWLATGPGLLLALTIAGLAVWRVRRALLVRRTEDPARRRVRTLLRRADRRLARRGLTRAPAESLHAFADRVAERLNEPAWGPWYGGLADLLYRPGLTAATAERAGRVPQPPLPPRSSPLRRRRQAARSPESQPV
ncbi:transglutaminase-like domain-containing protein [Alienimonas californiensis]|uniref:Protein-glutamine gamma-glutamyltransferase n=1 Tax=Alienimonas californiensis TaxID=2527989 RepID=A0A517P9W9_9PLAN|nr:transglutaminase-like domain-containing protein [Alienimonas californiensis]QDT16170.1 Protein-glutamine gamma-glutamyltransferase [Alienimonas californiensis]